MRKAYVHLPGPTMGAGLQNIVPTQPGRVTETSDAKPKVRQPPAAVDVATGGSVVPV
jgi:hypothetical protein